MPDLEAIANVLLEHVDGAFAIEGHPRAPQRCAFCKRSTEREMSGAIFFNESFLAQARAAGA